MAAMAKAAMLPMAGRFIAALEEEEETTDRMAELACELMEDTPEEADDRMLLTAEDCSAEAATTEAKARAAAMNFICKVCLVAWGGGGKAYLYLHTNNA